jgi:hypothetical protein
VRNWSEISSRKPCGWASACAVAAALSAPADNRRMRPRGAISNNERRKQQEITGLIDKAKPLLEEKK